MTFLEAAYKILKEKKKPLHSKEILRIALKKKLIKTEGKTPWETMNAQLLREIKSKGTKSRFIKTGPSIFAINQKCKKRKKKSKRVKTKKPLSEEFVKNSIVKWLSQNGWEILEISNLSGHGVDIKARKGRRVIFIETKGESQNRSGNEVNFVYGLGQLVTRMKVVDAPRAFNYALGVPTSVARLAVKRIPWKFAKKLTVEVFAVSSDGKMKRYTWQDLKIAQTNKR